MPFIVIERFESNDVVPVYRLAGEGAAAAGRARRCRFPDRGGLLPRLQLMRCEDARLLQQWVLAWRGTGVTSEIVPVTPSGATREAAAPHIG